MNTYTLPAEWRAVHILNDCAVDVFYRDKTTSERLTLPRTQYDALVTLWHAVFGDRRRDREYSAELRVVAMSLRRRSEQERNWPR